MTSILMMNEDIQNDIAALIAKAAAAPTSLQTVRNLAGARAKGITINPLHDIYSMDIPLNYRVTYTHEEQPGGMCRHLSISLKNRPDRAPLIEAVNALLKEFKFVNRVRENKPGVYAWLDKDGDTTIVNCLEPLDGDMNKLRRKEK